jgi:hypothetical protein
MAGNNNGYVGVDGAFKENKKAVISKCRLITLWKDQGFKFIGDNGVGD